MNRRRRSERRKDKEIFGGASPHIKRSIPFFDILDEDKLEIIAVSYTHLTLPTILRV